MAVEILGNGGEVNGWGDSMEAFRTADALNANALLNHMEGKKKNAFRPAFDPRHPDNQWPLALYHAEKGYMACGVNLKGLVGILREDAEKRNKADLKAALESGWRKEPYPVPQIALLDPLAEKAALVARNKELEGKIVVLTDQFSKFMARLDSVEKAVA